MKIGFIAHKVHRHGGMERASAEVMERIARRHEITIIARECEIHGPGLSFTPVVALPHPALLMNWSFRRKAARCERRLNAALTNSVGAAAIDADVITAQFCHAAFHEQFGSLRGGASRTRRWYQRGIERIFIRQEQEAYRSPRLKKVIAVSAGIKREIMQRYGVEDGCIAVIPNAVDHTVFRPAADRAAKAALRQALGLPEGAFVCLFVGGDWDRKGLAEAIRGVAGLPQTLLAVVGSGDRERFQEIARAAGTFAQVRFVGPSLAPQNYYAAADVFVFPSRYEAFSLVTLEAAAAGLPVLARRINGTEELIEDGVNGFFVTSAAEISARLSLLRDDPARLRAMSEAIRDGARRYTWERVAAEQMEVLEAVGQGQ